MKTLKSILKNRTFHISVLMVLVLFVLDLLKVSIGAVASGSASSLGLASLEKAGFQFIEMLKIVPPIFLLIGLLDVWVPREVMMKLMGQKSGAKGVLIAFFMGTLTAGPLVAAFPVAAIMLKKGAKYANVLFFLMIWASAKLPILFFQATQLGIKYTLVTNLTLITVYLIGTQVIEKILTHEEKEHIMTLAMGTEN